MPDYTVSGDVDSMLRSANDAAIRSAIGVGTTDAPTFLAQTLTGQSLTGTQATSLVDLSATWNTSGTPTAIKLNVVETGINSNAASNLMDLQVGGVSKFRVEKSAVFRFTGDSILFDGFGSNASALRCVAQESYSFSRGLVGTQRQNFSASGVKLANDQYLGFSSTADASGAVGTVFAVDGLGILAQRNLTNPQAFRVANSVGASPLVDYDRGVFDFKTTTNTLRIGTENGGTYTTARPIEFVTGGVARWQISAAGHLLSAGVTDGLYDIGASGANRPRSLYTSSIIDSGGKIICRSGSGIEVIVNGSTSCRLLATGDGVGLIANAFSNTFDRLQLGNTTDAFPAIARDGAGIKFTGAAAGSTSWIKVPAVAVASLPSAATAGVGARAFVNNALNPIFGNAVAGSGLSVVPVYSDGTNWNVG